MTMNTSELIANIRVWEAADAVVKAKIGMRLRDSGLLDAVDQRRIAGQRLVGRGYSDEALAAFVALADAHAQLEARIATLEAAHEPVMQISRLLSREYGDIYEGELAEPLEETLRLLDKWSDLLHDRVKPDTALQPHADSEGGGE